MSSKASRRSNDELTAAKNAEEAKVKALEKATMDDEAQKLSDMEYHKQRLARERDLARKIGAVEFMAQNVEPIFEAAFQHFESRGAWPDPVEYEIRKEFLPALVEGVAEQLQGEMLLAQKVLGRCHSGLRGWMQLSSGARAAEAAAAARGAGGGGGGATRGRGARNYKRLVWAPSQALGPVAVLRVLAVDLGDVRGDGVRLGHALAARPRVPLGARCDLHGPGLGGGVVADRHLLE